MLARVAGARHAAARSPSRHHERLDGSGYPRGLTARLPDPVGPAARGGRRLPRHDASRDRIERALDPAAAAAELHLGGAGRTPGRRRCRRGAHRRRAPGAARRDLARRADRPRGRGARAARPRAFEQGDRPAARRHAQDGRPTMSSTSTPRSACPAGRPRRCSPPSTDWSARSSRGEPPRRHVVAGDAGTGHGRASRMRLNGVAAARRMRVNLPRRVPPGRRGSPAWAPSPSPTSWASEVGVQNRVENP